MILCAVLGTEEDKYIVSCYKFIYCFYLLIILSFVDMQSGDSSKTWSNLGTGLVKKKKKLGIYMLIVMGNDKEIARVEE